MKEKVYDSVSKDVVGKEITLLGLPLKSIF